jgi:hypothetical protein
LYDEVKKASQKEEKRLVTTDKQKEGKGGSKVLHLVLGGVAGGVVALLAFSGGEQQKRGFPRPVGRPDDDD